MYVWGEKFTKESNFFTFQPCFTFYNVAKSLISFPSKLGPERVIPYISSFVLEKAYLFCNKVFAKHKKWISTLTLSSTYLRHQWFFGYMCLHWFKCQCWFSHTILNRCEKRIVLSQHFGIIKRRAMANNFFCM